MGPEGGGQNAEKDRTSGGVDDDPSVVFKIESSSIFPQCEHWKKPWSSARSFRRIIVPWKHLAQNAFPDIRARDIEL
jgi:hypothetical protein